MSAILDIQSGPRMLIFGRSVLLVELHAFEKIVEVPNDAMAFSSRGPWYNINVVLRWKSPELDSKVRFYALVAHGQVFW